MEHIEQTEIQALRQKVQELQAEIEKISQFNAAPTKVMAEKCEKADKLAEAASHIKITNRADGIWVHFKNAAVKVSDSDIIGGNVWNTVAGLMNAVTDYKEVIK